MSLKHKLRVICVSKDITLIDALKAYNAKYKKDIKNPSFYKMINDETMKYSLLTKLLDSIGYEIVFRRKRDVDQWKYFF